MKTSITILTFLLSFGDLFSQDYDTCTIKEMIKQGIDTYEIYYECDGIMCNGNKISFWSEDVINIKGQFKDGKPYDTLYIFDGKEEMLKYIDWENDIEWYLDMVGSVKYSSSGIDQTYYSQNGKKTISIFKTRPPSSLAKWTIEYDENEKPKVRYQENNINLYIHKKSIAKHLHDFDLTSEIVYELTIYSENITYLLSSKYYDEIPKNKSQIVEDSIITYFKKDDSGLFVFDLKKNKYFKVK